MGLDEKCSVQALDRAQPSLPMAAGRAQTMTHAYKRHGTATAGRGRAVLHPHFAPVGSGKVREAAGWMQYERCRRKGPLL